LNSTKDISPISPSVSSPISKPSKAYNYGEFVPLGMTEE